jgi:uncharacterized protein YdaU (DUF1376 family)
VKAPSPAFSLYPKDVLTDENVSAMTDEELGVYFRLLCHAWLEGSVPSDLTRMARILKRPLRTLKRLWPAIAPCWDEADGRLTQRKLEAVRAQQVAFRNEQSRKGKLGGKPRHINETSKPWLSPGLTEPKPKVTLPSPSPFPSSVNERIERTSGSDNPLLGDRVQREKDVLRLVARMAELNGTDPVEELIAAAHYEGARSQKVNPATMSPDRLLNTWSDLKANVKAAESRIEAKRIEAAKRERAERIQG